MAQQKFNPSDTKTGKVGSDTDAAKSVGGRDDFGVRADDRVGRDYVSRETKQQDPTNEVARSGGPEQPDDQGPRTSGAGGNASGVGSSSGGDLDTDFTGVIGSFAQAGPDDRTEGPDMVGTANTAGGAGDAFASGKPAQGKNQTHVNEVGGGGRVRGSTTSPASDVSTGQDAQGAAASTNSAARADDSFAGEISDDEASGTIESQ